MQHEEFSDLSKDEVLAYFKKCKHSGISNDDLLQAALT